MDRRSRGFGVPPPYGDEFTPGAQNGGLASGRGWAIVGLLVGLAVLGAPGATWGDKLRRAGQCLLWEIIAAVIIIEVLRFTWGILLGVLGHV